jgi:hypothetical protein
LTLTDHLTGLPRLFLGGIYRELSWEEEARVEAAELLRFNPHYSVEVDRQRLPHKDPAASERHIAALCKAGLK